MTDRCAVCGQTEGITVVSYRLGVALCGRHLRQVERAIKGITNSDLAEAVGKCRERHVRQHGYAGTDKGMERWRRVPGMG